jgi:hypothetical protein
MDAAGAFFLDIHCPGCGALLRAFVDAPQHSLDDPVERVTWTCPSCRKQHANHFGGPLIRIIVRYEDKAKH